MADVVYGWPKILTLKLLRKNDANDKQRLKRLHWEVRDLKSDNQGLCPDSEIQAKSRE